MYPRIPCKLKGSAMHTLGTTGLNYVRKLGSSLTQNIDNREQKGQTLNVV